MPAMNDNTLRTRISHTWVGQEYGWDFADQADVTLLRETCARRIDPAQPAPLPAAPQAKAEGHRRDRRFLVLYMGERA